MIGDKERGRFILQCVQTAMGKLLNRGLVHCIHRRICNLGLEVIDCIDTCAEFSYLFASHTGVDETHDLGEGEFIHESLDRIRNLFIPIRSNVSEVRNNGLHIEWIPCKVHQKNENCQDQARILLNTFIMRIIPPSFGLIKLALILAMIPYGCSAQSHMAESCSHAFRTFLNEQSQEFSNVEKTPLATEDFARFKTLNYFPFDKEYCVMASLVRTPDEEPFEMPTSTDRLPVYVKYGELHFELKGEEMQLAIYQNLALMEDEEYKDYLFLPFNDLTNGVESYGGGRYIDFRIPDGDELRLDFNSSYHPYCAYNPLYSCPIPPEENIMDVRIAAGVMSGINGEKGYKH